MDLGGQKVLTIGLGRSGVAAARLCLDKGARVIATDAAPRERLSKEALALEAAGATLAAGGHPDALFDGIDLVVISPGVPSFPALEAFERAGGEVIGELELAARFFVGTPIALIGGTNGKSTTTALVHAMLESAGKKAFIGGNFGTPLAEVVGQPFDVIVLEISSFQAERVPTLHARAHALLNITDDHLDRYPGFQAYADAKGNPFVRMTAEDTAVIPYGDPICAKQAARGGARVVTFSATEEAATVRPVGGNIAHRDAWHSFPLDALQIAGRHNIENACAALGVVAAFDVPFDDSADSWLTRAVRNFRGLGHRTVLVGEIDGVRYYDDSKGTNVGASVAALRGLTEDKAVLIAGGKDKLGAYEPLVDALRHKGRALVLIGEAADRIAAAAKGVLPIERAGSMAEAVQIARRLAEPGDAVLLSPACSSFDMFRDYKDRGDQFAQAVQSMLEVRS
ncbi:UDP-N-acetylmuramoyl-L-alanine--D-glutamate ligase [Polyangium sp. y55x31]|uniref:UDP-N-acetylmuramoyl-L-alanine--D-glutamate ligase n=1 Tax=Polyangium sp. y55x31 TaxID=3042688 RepID=UPI002482B922|nr:UDP-N-acetylmuramoyl-L-alanine--D-glutamate ligase [Polyangium sp. y55x31]MDI1481516.1 UDP-N-acetylmuramoyl-L-alanine--D-glutamate ligase [Polyangium sp. y55x31]